MALIKNFMNLTDTKTKESLVANPKPHKETRANCFTFRDYTSGEQYLQIDSFGSKSRQVKGAKSQTMQFSEEGMRQLKKVIDDTLE